MCPLFDTGLFDTGLFGSGRTGLVSGSESLTGAVYQVLPSGTGGSTSGSTSGSVGSGASCASPGWPTGPCAVAVGAAVGAADSGAAAAGADTLTVSTRARSFGVKPSTSKTAFLR